MKFSILTSLSIAVSSVAAGSAGFYAKDANVYELTPKNFDKVVLDTNYTSIVEFYAPWCGYCKQIKSVYQKLAKYIQDDAKYAVNVVSVNCDEDSNKPSARNTVCKFVSSRIKNYVKKFHNLSSKSFAEWLNVDDGLEKIVVLSGSDTVSALLRSLAIDFLDTLSVASVSVKTKSHKPTITYGDHEIEVPLEESDSLPVLLVYKKDEKRFVRYPAKKLRHMNKIQKFIMETTGVVPSEGSLSKKEKKLRKFRGVSRNIKDEL
ncbi:hypothetical protein JCM33374_g1819 [Metschnikowia sp. JCM 33374]|nr:hypothetical protein JCM33374_g1819 [Metschnikowia sp. JCM 33374]